MCELRDPNGTIWECATTLQKENDRLKERVAELEKLNEWHKKDVHDAMEWKRDLEAKLKEAENTISEAHAILDGDESKIIRNAKDGYPDGRPDRILTLAERVKAICKYGADYKRWLSEAEDRLANSWAKVSVEEIKTVIWECDGLPNLTSYSVEQLATALIKFLGGGKDVS